MKLVAQILSLIFILVIIVDSQRENILTIHNFTEPQNNFSPKVGRPLTNSGFEASFPDASADRCLSTQDLSASGDQCQSDRYLDIDSNNPVKKTEFNKVKPCYGFTCPYQSTCGSAPLNPYTRPKKKGRTPYVVFGEPETYGEWPQYVRLSINGTILCGGVLITNRHILTAAHCTYYRGESLGPENFRIHLADHSRYSRDSHEKTAQVASICRSSMYSPRSDTTKYDYSVLTLSRTVGFNDHIQPACLPYRPIRIGLRDTSTRCYVLGFGSMGFDRGNALVLQKLRVRRSSCRKWLFRDDDRSRMCFTNYKGRGDSCSGDSGGPIMCLIDKKRWTVVGLVSYGSSECDGSDQTGWVAVYTRVRALLEYIQADCGI